MNSKRIQFHSWNRFNTENLFIVPALIGSSHCFDFDEANIAIQLPDKEELSHDRSEESRLAISAWNKEDGIQKPTKVAVQSVDLLCSFGASLVVPEESLKRPPIAIDLFEEKQRTQVDRKADIYFSTACEAFEYWVKIVRWKSGNGSICASRVKGYQSGWGTYLRDDATQHRFWVKTQPIIVYFPDAVTEKQWIATQETLKQGLKSPAYIDLLFEGKEQFKSKDFRRTVIELAVACESYIRVQVQDRLPGDLLSSIAKYVDDANIRQVLTHFFPEILDEEQKRKLKAINSKLQGLFDCRNTILHSGYKDELSETECKHYINAANELILKNLQG